MTLLNWPPPDHLWIQQFLPSQRLTNARASIPAEILALGPSCVSPIAAAQTRIVSVARIRLDSRESERLFKGIICDDVSEFESHMASQPVVSVGACPSGLRARPLSQWLYSVLAEHRRR